MNLAWQSRSQTVWAVLSPSSCRAAAYVKEIVLGVLGGVLLVVVGIGLVIYR